jgi:hypothetical protein
MIYKLTKLMFELDIRLFHGFSRELIARALMTPEMQLKYGKVRPVVVEEDDKEEKKEVGPTDLLYPVMTKMDK